jgi:uncharacterized protein YjbI with pentapeptide repeats
MIDEMGKKLPDLPESPSRRIDIYSRNLIAMVLGIILGALVALTGLPAIEEHLPTLIVGFLIIIALAVVFTFIIVQRKDRVLKKVFGVNDTDLSIVKDSSQAFFIEAWNRNYEEAKTHFDAVFKVVFAWYSWMNFRRWVLTVFQTLFVGFGGLLGTVLLYNQNKLLLQQNEMLRHQSTRLDQQTYLQEADRRSSLIFLMGNLLDAMDKELKEDLGQPGVRDLSPQMIGRVVALSNSLRPYRFLESDSLVKRELSPERGQLLISLINSQIDNRSLRKIFQFANFSFADLNGAVLSGEYLSGINLRSANLKNAFLDATELSQADLSHADLYGAILEGAILKRSNLSYADIRHTSLISVDMQEAFLSWANLSGSPLPTMNLLGATLDNAILDSAIVKNENWLAENLTLGRDSIVGNAYIGRNYETVKDSRTTGILRYILLPKPKPTIKK